MKAFLIYIAKIGSVLLLICFILQAMADFGLKKLPNTLTSQWADITEGNINSELVILGSSRGFVCYDPTILGNATGNKAYNLSFNAGSFNLQQPKYEIYRAKNNKPKILIQNVDIAHFKASTDLPDEYQFLPFFGHKIIQKEFLVLHNDGTIFRFLPLLKYNGNKLFFWRGIKSFFGIETKKMQTIFSGYSPQESQFKQDNHNLERLKLESLDFKKYYDGFLKVKQFLKRNASDSVRVIMVWAPEHYKRLNAEKSISEKLKREISIFEKEEKNVDFIDMSHDSISMHDEYFYDTFHLNEKGATLFSTTLAQKINDLK
jgi:hypothetical protein